MATTGVNTNQIEDGAVTNPKLGIAAVTEDKIQTLAVTTSRINTSAVTTNRINNLAVTAGKLADGAVTTQKINDAAVQNAKIGDAQISTAKLVNASVDATKLANNSVVSARIQDGAVIAAKLGSNAVTEDKIQNEAVTIGKVGSGAVAANNLIVSDGSGGANWADPSGVGSRVLLVNRTFSGSGSEDFDNTIFTSTYTAYEMLLTEITVSANNTQLELLTSHDNGSTIRTSGYYRAGIGRKANALTFTQENTSASSIHLAGLSGSNDALGNGIGNFYAGRFMLTGLLMVSQFRVWGDAAWNPGGGTFAMMSMGGGRSSDSVNWIRVDPTGGTFSGRIKIYGIR